MFFLINFNLWRWSCACVGVNNWVIAYISFYRSHSAQRSKTPALVDRHELCWDFALLRCRARRRLVCHRYLGTAYRFHVHQPRCAKSKLSSSTFVPKRPRQTNLRRVTTQKREYLNSTTPRAWKLARIRLHILHSTPTVTPVIWKHTK